MLYKRDVLKNFSKITDKLKKKSSGSALSKDVLKNFAKFIEKHFCGNLFCNKVAGCRSGGFLAKFTGKHLCQSLYLNKVADLAYNFIKIETLAQVFSCEFCKIAKNTFFTEHIWATASLYIRIFKVIFGNFWMNKLISFDS